MSNLWSEFTWSAQEQFSSLGTRIRETLAGIKKFFADVNRALKVDWQKMIMWMSDQLLSVLKTTQNLTHEFRQLFGMGTADSPFQSIVESLEDMRFGAEAEISMIRAGMRDTIEDIAVEAEEGTGIIRKTATDAMQELGAGFKTVLDKIMGLVPKGLVGQAGPTKELDNLIEKLKAAAGKATKVVTSRAREREARLDLEESVARTASASDDLADGTASIASGTLTLGESLSAAALDLSSKLGSLGKIIGSAAKGFETGGIWGAIIAVIAEIIAMLPAFEDIIEIFEYDLGQLMEALNPIAEAFRAMTNIISVSLTPVFEEIASVMDVLVTKGLNPFLQGIGQFTAVMSGTIVQSLRVLAPIFELFGTALRGLGIIIGGVSWIVAHVVNGIGEVIGWLVDAFAEIIGIFDGKAKDDIKKFADSITEAKIDTGEIERNIANIGAGKDVTWSAKDRAEAEEERREAFLESLKGLDASNIEIASHELGELKIASEDLTDAKKKETDAIKEATAALMNVPTGYKIAQARFAATSPGMAFGGFSPAAAGMGLGGVSTQNITVNIDTIQADSPEDLARALAQETAWRNLVNTGSTVSSAPSPGRK
jgi:hypothetical protein